MVLDAAALGAYLCYAQHTYENTGNSKGDVIERMSEFLSHWSDAALTSLGFLWMAFWAFALGYIISSCIQIFVTRQRMQQSMGEAGPQSQTPRSIGPQQEI